VRFWIRPKKETTIRADDSRWHYGLHGGNFISLSFIEAYSTPFVSFFSLKSYWGKIMTRNVTYMGKNILFPFFGHSVDPFSFFRLGSVLSYMVIPAQPTDIQL